MTTSYTPYNEFLNKPAQTNPHSPAPASVRQQPVEIPGVITQTQQLFKPYESKENK